MRILLLGADGQVGTDLREVLSSVGEIKGTVRDDLNLKNFDAIRDVVRTYDPNVIVNAAAYTAVDNAENEFDLAHSINGEAVGVLAQEAKDCGAWLIHYSTDYVFNGLKKEPYLETDLPSPISVYGQSKLAGENAIHEVGGQHVIFRTSWVIGLHGHNFAKTILRLSMERESLRVVNDQFGVPTTASLIARITRGVILRISRGEWDTGLYHLAPRGETTWYEVARTLIDVAAKKGLPIVLNKNEIQPIATDDYPAKAKRPLSSRLNTKKLEDMLNMELPNWKDEFIQVANEIVEGLKVA